MGHEIQSMVDGRSGIFCFGFPQGVNFMKKGEIASFRCYSRTLSKKGRNQQVIGILKQALHTGEGTAMLPFWLSPQAYGKVRKWIKWAINSHFT